MQRGKPCRLTAAGIGLCISIGAMAPCWAIAPASRQQLLCADDYIVEATVLSAERPCTTADGVRTCVGDDETLHLEMRIDRLIARKDALRFAEGEADRALVGTVRSGDVHSIPLSSADEAEWQNILLGLIRASSADATRSAADPADRLRTSLAVQRRERNRFIESRMKDHLVGYRFVFGLNFSRSLPGSFDGRGWGIDQNSRIVDLLTKAGGTSCAKLREDGPEHASNVSGAN